MKGDILSTLYEWFQGEFPSTILFASLAILGAFVFVTFILALILIKRKGRRFDMDSILRGTEELLRGNFSWRIAARSRGSLFKIASNINQLASDFRVRTSEVEGVRDHYRNLVESLQDYALISTNQDWEITSFNSAAISLFGWNQEDIRGKSISILFSETFWLGLLPAIAKKELKIGTRKYQSEFRKKSGELFAGYASIYPLKSKSGESRGYVITIKEASEEMRLEQELKESEERYRSLVEALAEGVFILQEEKIVYANKTLCNMLHITREELVGRRFKDFILTEDLIFVVSTLRELEKTQRKAERLFLQICDSTKSTNMEVLLMASSIPYQGKPAIIASVMDVTETKRIEREIKRNESRLDATLDSVSEGLMMVHYTLQGPIIVLANKSFKNFFGIDPEKIIGASLESVQKKISVFFQDESDFLLKSGEWLKYQDKKESFVFETKGLEEKIIECFSAPVYEKEGLITGRVFSFRDVTGQKEFEGRLKENVQDLQKSKEALEKSYRELNMVNQELQRRTKQLDQINQDLRTLDEMKTKLLTNVSHELQTPLVSIKGYTEMILKGKLGTITEEQERGLQISLRNIERLINMIDSLLNFSRIEKAEDHLHLETFPIWELIDESIELVRENMEARHISITTQYQTDELSVQADRERMAQVFINLLSNAIKFNKQGGKVSVTVRKASPEQLLVDISDTGIGIPEEHLDKIFERFFRAEDPSKKIKGTGVGLSIVKDILTMHQCKIDVHSKIGEGSIFSFTLPSAKASRKPEGQNHFIQDDKKDSQEKLLHFQQETSKSSRVDREEGVIKIKIIKKLPQNKSL